MYKTAWTGKTSSVPSDRIRPIHQQTPVSFKGKGKQQPSEPPKSREVRRLEALLYALRDSGETDKDPKGGCFCQAREHALSPYSPLCNTCGLILCSINLPHYSCPHCTIPVVTTAIRKTLVVKLESQISEVIAREIRDREQSLEEARQAAGAFPTLTGPTSKSPALLPTPTTNQTHKVLSLNNKTKRVVVSSYTTTPVSSRPNSRAESEEGPVRIPPPSTEVDFAKESVDHSRPWKNLRKSGIEYISLVRVDDQLQGIPKDTKKGRKGKGKAN